jgi:DNA topoisomerase-1
MESVLGLKDRDRTLTVRSRQERVAHSRAPKPFITSTLQQEASSRFRMNPKATMKAAQTLYEGGFITYMRTDNAVLSQEAVEAASAVVVARWGEEYLDSAAPSAEEGTETGASPKKRVVKKKKAAATAGAEPQAAHEAIRPTKMELAELTDEQAGGAEQRLYRLIWMRTIQSVMAAEERDVVSVSATPTAAQELITLTSGWDRVRFPGWRIVGSSDDDSDKSSVAGIDDFEARRAIVEGTRIDKVTWRAGEVRTSPPSRYTEASLIRELERVGIGRPSTYATLVETVMDRKYVERANTPATTVSLKTMEIAPTGRTIKRGEQKEKTGGEKDKLRTTALGRTVIEWLLGQFSDMIDYGFTAAMEAQLDTIAKGDQMWDTILSDTWNRYKDRYAAIMGSSSSSSKKGASTDAASPRTSSKCTEFGDGYKLVMSKKGPLFVHEVAGEKTRFANVPAYLSAATATRADAETAFHTATVATTGDSLGELEGRPVIRKSGRYGAYVVWGDVSVNCKEGETLEELTPRLQAKASPTSVDHTVGPYKIRRGPYGLYMFKVANGAGSKKPVFISLPETTEWRTLTVEGAEALYSTASKAKKAPRKAAT